MTTKPPAERSFARFYKATTGHDPYQWQVHLALAWANGQPVDSVTVPVGWGKGSAPYLWAWALAHDIRRQKHDGDTRRVPLRYTHVVDRRCVVDKTSGDAETLASQLEEALRHPHQADPEVLLAAQTFQDFAPDAPRVLAVHVLRGGMDIRPEGPRHPAAPAIVVGTIDLVGSRLLFRGYGVSRGRRPIDAALFGIDNMLVLDEAHLARQFHTTLRLVDRHTHACASPRGIPPLQVVTMTATPEEETDPFDWDDELEAQPTLAARRVNRGTMRVELLHGSGTSDKVLLTSARTLPLEETCILLFFNTARGARDAAQVLAARKDLQGREVVLLVGGMPELARTGALERLRPFMSGADRSAGTPVVICATQTVEVGADLDADALWTSVSSVASLRQRLGRVNRIGSRPNGRVTVSIGSSTDPVYSDAMAVGQTLTAAPPSTILELEEAMATIPAPASAPSTLMPRYVWDSYLRTQGSPNEAEVGRWLRSPQDERLQFQVAFRESVAAIRSDHALLDHLSRHPPRADEVWTIAGDGAAALWSTPSSRLRAVVFDSSGRTPPVVSEIPAPRPTPGMIVVLAPQTGSMSITDFGADLLTRFPPEDRPFYLEPDEPAKIDVDHDSSSFLADWVSRVLYDEDGEPAGWLERSRASVPAVEGALAGRTCTLEEHQRDVAERCREWATRMGLGPELVRDLTLAAQMHDEGKREQAIQDQFHLELDDSGELVKRTDGEVLAKSGLPALRWRQASLLANVPRGFRHEARSAEELDRRIRTGELVATDHELVRHLVLSHHGYFRGLGPWVEDSTMSSPPIYQDPSDPAWAAHAETFGRLNERYGAYALALTESIVRLADWYESKDY